MKKAEVKVKSKIIPSLRLKTYTSINQRMIIKLNGYLIFYK